MDKNVYTDLKNHLLSEKYSWLITGVAGFIGSHIAEELIKLNQNVYGVDNFLTGKKANIDLLLSLNNSNKDSSFIFKNLDISFYESLASLPNTDFVIHQAALGSVPRSIKKPLDSHNNNVNGFLNIILHAVKIKAKAFVYASSSSVYGNNLKLPKMEGFEGTALSPYAATKSINEVYAEAFSLSYGLKTIGLRYFNVFGPRQDPSGEYAAVIPRWIKLISANKPIEVFGDGSTTRDFCYIENAVQANLLSAFSKDSNGASNVLNIACGSKTSLNKLACLIEERIKVYKPNIKLKKVLKDFRKGDIKDSLADIRKAQNEIGYIPSKTFEEGLVDTIDKIYKNS